MQIKKALYTQKQISKCADSYLSKETTSSQVLLKTITVLPLDLQARCMGTLSVGQELFTIIIQSWSQLRPVIWPSWESFFSCKNQRLEFNVSTVIACINGGNIFLSTQACGEGLRTSQVPGTIVGAQRNEGLTSGAMQGSRVKLAPMQGSRVKLQGEDVQHLE